MKKIIFFLLIFPSLVFGQATGKIINNKPTGGTIIVDTINASSLLNLNQTTAGQTIILGSLTSGGKTIYVRNIGSASVTMSPGGTLAIGTMLIYGWTGSAWSYISAGSGSVSNVSSANSDISVSSPTTTPILTLNSGTGNNQIVKRDGSGNITFASGNHGITFPSAATIYDNIGNITIQSGFNRGITISADTGITLNTRNIILETIGNISIPNFTPNRILYLNSLNQIITPFDTTYTTSTAQNGGRISVADWNFFNNKQAALVSGTNIKTVNGNSLLGSGNVAVGDALIANPLSQFASTTSSQLAGVLSDETGTGAAVFANSPTLVTPTLGVASSTSSTITGMGGNGFISLPTQSSNPSAPSSGTVLFSNSNSKLSWRGSANNFVKTFDGSAATADRVYSLPNVDGTVITTGDTGTVTNSMLAGSIDLTSKVTGILPGTNGGTGVNNSTRTMTYAGNVAFTGAFNPTFSIPRSTTWTLPNTANETLAGLGTVNAFTVRQSIAAGTLTDGSNALSITATMPTTITAGSSAVSFAVTSAGSSSQNNRALSVTYLTGYAGSSQTAAGLFANGVSGTGTSIINSSANFGINASSTGSTTGYNTGVRGSGSNGNISIGVFGMATTAKSSATNIGGVFLGNNSGSSPIQVGVYAGLNTSDPTFTSAALLVDNAAASSPIAIFRANGSAVVTFGSAGAATFTSTLSSAGVTDGSNASTGIVGETQIMTTSSYTNYTTTATYQVIDSIVLTAGDWDISAMATLSSNSATITGASNAIFVISTTKASASGSTEGLNIVYVPQAALLGTSKESIAIPPYKVSISSTTTYYLNSQATFTLGNPQFVGTLRARRER